MNNKLIVLGILSRDRADEFIIAKREIKNAAIEWIEKQTQAFQLERQELRDAKQLRIEEAEDRNDQRALRAAKSIRIDMDDIQRKEVGFAWVDGIFWERWIKTTFGIQVRDGERVVVNDESVSSIYDYRLHDKAHSRKSTNSIFFFFCLETPFLGYNNHRQPHRTLTHKHPRDPQQNRREPPEDNPEIEYPAPAHPALYPRHDERAPVPDFLAGAHRLRGRVLHVRPARW